MYFSQYVGIGHHHDIRLSIDPKYLNVAVLFIGECMLHCFILGNLFQ